jgi:hypothetical protein
MKIMCCGDHYKEEKELEEVGGEEKGEEIFIQYRHYLH